MLPAGTHSRSVFTAALFPLLLMIGGTLGLHALQVNAVDSAPVLIARKTGGPTTPADPGVAFLTPIERWQLDPPPTVARELATADDLAFDGRTLFIKYCGGCHGNEGRGNGIYYADSVKPKPADLTQPPVGSHGWKDCVATVVRDGSRKIGKSPLCPPWSNVLSGEQITAVATYVVDLARPLDHEP
ncbi:MAG: cytochrome c [Pirellulaceae bacterium]